MPEDIESVKVLCHPTVELPCFQNTEVNNIIDTQFGIAYVFAVAANRVKVGVEWQDKATMKDPKVLGFMKKVSSHGHPDYGRLHMKDPLTTIGMVEVVAKGKTFKEEKISRSFPTTDVVITDDYLVEKFRDNASRVLPQNKIDEAAEAILKMETVSGISEVMKLVRV
jgi:2-methylcitrate dehydratase PrpD